MVLLRRYYNITKKIFFTSFFFIHVYFLLQKKEMNSDSENHRSVSMLFLLILFKMGLFGAAYGWGPQSDPLPKICHTHPVMMKLDTVMPYLKKIHKIYESCDTLLEFC